MKARIIQLLTGLILLTTACKKQPGEAEAATTVSRFEAARGYYLENIERSIAYLDTLQTLDAADPRAKEFFKGAREAFKKAEPLASYLNPDVGHRANGPALPVFLEDTGKVLLPLGLQKIEESIYDGGENPIIFKKEVEITRGLLNNLKGYMETKELTAERFFIATHQQLLRIISLGISGFDTPVSHLGLYESQVSLKGLFEVYKSAVQDLILIKNPELDQSFKNQIELALGYLQANTDFERFDRFTFIRDHMNPITSSWVKIRQESDLWEGSRNFAINFEAPTFFEANSFNVDYFVSQRHRNPDRKMIELGEKLFYEPRLSEDGRMACASCHMPDKAFADGLKFNTDNAGKPLGRNTPTLINSVYQQALFWDGRSATLRDQISSVFTNEKEFASGVHQLSAEILKDSMYVAMFKEAYGKEPKRNLELIGALSAYIGTLNAFQSRFDRNIRAEANNFTASEKNGFNLYMGKALCATCHFIPLTNGTVPPFFHETEKEVIGVPETAANEEVDDDTGFYWVYGADLHKGMFKTPTVRNSAVTAPYMHNGVYSSLEEVMEFYNLGGGGGMGFDLPYQTLPFDKLDLTKEEVEDLIAFLHTLTDVDVSNSTEAGQPLALEQ